MSKVCRGAVTAGTERTARGVCLLLSPLLHQPFYRGVVYQRQAVAPKAFAANDLHQM